MSGFKQSTNWLARCLMVVPLLAVACSGDRSNEAQEPVLVFAAASLTEAFDEIARSFEAVNPGIEVTINTAGSSALREQILQGAPADVFASANVANMKQLFAEGEVVDPLHMFAQNSLVIAVPSGNPASIESLSDFSNPDHLIGLCAEAVPCGELSRSLFQLTGIEASVDTYETDVRSLLTKIGADELDAGLVYRSDIKSAGELVEAVPVPEAEGLFNNYLIASLVDSPNPGGAEAFVAFVNSEVGQQILAKYGFVVNE